MVSGAFELLPLVPLLPLAVLGVQSAEGLLVLQGCKGCKRVFSKKVNRSSEGYSDVIVTIYIVKLTKEVLF